jgi:hypothetical protein
VPRLIVDAQIQVYAQANAYAKAQASLDSSLFSSIAYLELGKKLFRKIHSKCP